MRPPLLQRLPLPQQVRATGRHAALTATSAALRARIRHALATPRVHFIYMHFLPLDESDALRSLIKALRKDHEIVSYSTAVEAIRTDKVKAPLVSFSFDDGFYSNLHAARLLEDEGVSACFFLCSGLMQKPIEEVAHAYSGSVGTEPRTLSWAEAEELIERGHEIGSHTVTHRTLYDLSVPDVYAELSSSKAELESRLGPVQHFAWPRGQRHHFRVDRDVQTAFDIGYASVASAVRGAHASPMGSSQPILYREHYQTAWPLNHILYFLGRSSRRAIKGDLPQFESVV